MKYFNIIKLNDLNATYVVTICIIRYMFYENDQNFAKTVHYFVLMKYSTLQNKRIKR